MFNLYLTGTYLDIGFDDIFDMIIESMLDMLDFLDIFDAEIPMESSCALNSADNETDTN